MILNAAARLSLPSPDRQPFFRRCSEGSGECNRNKRCVTSSCICGRQLFQRQHGVHKVLLSKWMFRQIELFLPFVLRHRRCCWCFCNPATIAVLHNTKKGDLSLQELTHGSISVGSYLPKLPGTTSAVVFKNNLRFRDLELSGAGAPFYICGRPTEALVNFSLLTCIWSSRYMCTIPLRLLALCRENIHQRDIRGNVAFDSTLYSILNVIL